jgi:hypothetical protein
MKHHWKIRRQLKPYPDGQQRWDRAYQYLLRWTTSEPPMQSSVSETPNPNQEVNDADSNLCSRVDPAPGARPND